MSGQAVHIERASEVMAKGYKALAFSLESIYTYPTICDLGAGELKAIARHLEEARAIMARHGLEV